MATREQINWFLQASSQLHPARFYERFKYSYAQKAEAEREYAKMLCHFVNYNDRQVKANAIAHIGRLSLMINDLESGNYWQTVREKAVETEMQYDKLVHRASTFKRVYEEHKIYGEYINKRARQMLNNSPCPDHRPIATESEPEFESMETDSEKNDSAIDMGSEIIETDSEKSDNDDYYG